MAIVPVRLKSGTRYKVLVRDDEGQWFQIRTFDSKGEARAHEGDLLARRAKGARAQTRESRELTLEQFWAQWSVTCRQKVGAGWRMSQDQMWRDHVKPYLGHLAVREITAQQIGAHLTTLEAKPKELGPQTRLHVFNLLSRMFQDAIDVFEPSIRESNPVLKKFQPTLPRVERKFWKPAMAWQFLHAVKDHELGPAFWIMTLEGLRTAEMQALRWGNVDLDASEISVVEQYRRKAKEIAPLKNGQPNRIPMFPELVKYLRERRPAGAQDHDFVVADAIGGMVTHSIIQKRLRQLAKAHKIPPITPHELRHTCSEIWIERGATKEDMRRIYNHSSEASTSRYIHRTQERLKHVAAQAPLRLVKTVNARH